MNRIDADRCAALVRQITDAIAASGPKAGTGLPLAEQIGHVRQISAAAETQLRAALAELYPDIGWTGEEAGPGGADYWLYDPIDGAYHYLQGLPLWSASLVLVQAGEAVLSIVYDPALGEMFMARQGEGASCNGAAILASAKSDLAAAVVGSAVPPLAQVGPAEQEQGLALIATIARSVFVVRPMAAASLQLAYVAAGRLDAYAETGQDAADWLAGALLVREAGGIVTDLDGAAFGWTGRGVLAGGSIVQPGLCAITGAA